MPLVFPVSLKNARIPVVSDGFHLRSGGKFHYGVDILYRRNKDEPYFKPWGTQNYIMFPNTAAVAATDGVIGKAEFIGTGGIVWVDSSSNFRTKYMHLSSLSVRKGDRVKAGDVIGAIGDDPKNPNDPAHLHFEIHTGGNAVDPEPLLKNALYVERSVGIGVLEIAMIGGVLWYVTR